MLTNESDAASTPALPPGAILALSVAGFTSALSVRVTDALLPRLATEFDVSLGQAASVITAFSVAYGLAQLGFGPLGDRFGKYLVIAWCCVASVFTSVLCALAPGFHALVAARLCAGITCAALMPLSLAWIGDVVPYERRQPVLGRFLVGQILGLSGGALVGGFAADHLGWRTPFWGVAAIFAVIGTVLLRLNRRLPPAARLARPASGQALRRSAAEFAQVLALPWARTLLLCVFLEGVCLFGAFAFIATHLHQVFGLSLASAGSLVLSFGLGGLMFASLVGMLVRELGEVRMVLAGGALVALSFGLIAYAPVWWWALPACVLAGLGFYMFHNTLQTNATQMAPERRGAAVAAFACCYFLGQAVGVALLALAAARVGTAPAILFGGCGVLGVALVFAWRRTVSLRPAPA